ncbi:polysaccharide deacetylase family protein [Azospirillum sp. YIM DDC1]|uniref:Chitooligosaccharide deacetylase n=1 Tax=Azospirillum aestuarii TaxID=2802052 RepID=A0ABS1I3Q2_9PROT|nr:polysaccharide deacetylase family protein [Azospirillum aestuarii]MBK4721672.1 polysaccharide deacetylase family protein [Azospirillum aestuarii]
MTNPRISYRLSDARPTLPDFQGRRIIAHLVVNVENWRFDEAMPRTIITPPHGRETVPDVPNFSWADYGMRSGLPRILKLFRDRGVPASTSLNAGVIDAYPQAAEAMLAAGWEFIGHGMHQKAINHAGDGEEALIEAALDRIQRFTGKRPRGWLSPGLRETVQTPDLLRRQGIDHVFDWVVDDLPSWMRTAHGPLLAMPYNLEINDSIVYAIEKHATGEMLSRLGHTLRLFERECAENPRVLAIGLHPHLIAVPHRLHELEAMLDLLQASPHVAFATGPEIADWYAAAEPATESGEG